MKTKILIGLLIIGILLISGCVEQQPEEKAKQLADGTAEGKMVVVMDQSFSKIKDCTMDEILSNLDELYESQGREYNGLTNEEKAGVEIALEDAKKCMQGIERDVSKISETEYLVSYSFNIPAGCQDSMPSGGEDFLQIEVNTAAGTTNVIKGAFDESQKQELQNRIQQIEDMGNCGAVMMIGTVSSSTVSSSPAPVTVT